MKSRVLSLVILSIFGNSAKADFPSIQRGCEWIASQIFPVKSSLLQAAVDQMQRPSVDVDEHLARVRRFVLDENSVSLSSRGSDSIDVIIPNDATVIKNTVSTMVSYFLDNSIAGQNWAQLTEYYANRSGMTLESYENSAQKQSVAAALAFLSQKERKSAEIFKADYVGGRPVKAFIEIDRLPDGNFRLLAQQARNNGVHNDLAKLFPDITIIPLSSSLSFPSQLFADSQLSFNPLLSFLRKLKAHFVEKSCTPLEKTELTAESLIRKLKSSFIRNFFENEIRQSLDWKFADDIKEALQGKNKSVPADSIQNIQELKQMIMNLTGGRSLATNRKKLLFIQEINTAFAKSSPSFSKARYSSREKIEFYLPSGKKIRINIRYRASYRINTDGSLDVRIFPDTEKFWAYVSFDDDELDLVPNQAEIDETAKDVLDHFQQALAERR